MRSQSHLNLITYRMSAFIKVLQQNPGVAESLMIFPCLYAPLSLIGNYLLKLLPITRYPLQDIEAKIFSTSSMINNSTAVVNFFVKADKNNLNCQVQNYLCF